MRKFLHCTSMKIVVETLPQVLFATHRYSVWYLVMLVMFNSSPSVIWPLLALSQKTVKGGVPMVTTHSFFISVPSVTVVFCTCSTAGRSGRKNRKVYLAFLFKLKRQKIIHSNVSFLNPLSKPIWMQYCRRLTRCENLGDLWEFSKECVNVSILMKLSLERLLTNF